MDEPIGQEVTLQLLTTVRDLGAGFTVALVLFIVGLWQGWWHMNAEYQAALRLAEYWEKRAKANGVPPKGD